MSAPTLRVHLGAGRIYLAPDAGGAWVNVDLEGPHTALASQRPDLVDRWRTTDGADYYARQNVTVAELAAGPLPPAATICDVYGDVLRGLPFGPLQVDEVLCRQMFEHFSRHEARAFLREMDYSIKPGGILRLDVPDVDGVLGALAVEHDADRRALLLRHLIGSRKDDYSYHHHGYTRAGLRRLVEEYGFEFVEEEPPLLGRLYPAFCLRFRKPALSAIDPVPWQRLIDPATIPTDWVCGEIGPGSRSYWPRANVVVDVVDRGADDLPPGARFVQADLADGVREIADGALDFVLASHVLEHVADPAAACVALSRIARRGVVECPSPQKEALFGFEGAGFGHQEYAGHEWWVTPGPENVIVFTRPNARMMAALASRDAAAAMHRMLRLGPAACPDAIILRRWFTTNHAAWNTIVRWEGALRAEVRDY